MSLSPIQKLEFHRAANQLMDFMKANTHPHCSIIATSDSVEIVEGVAVENREPHGMNVGSAGHLDHSLKPCPFCGGEAEIWRAHPESPKRNAWIACLKRCAVITKEFDTTDEAINTWNTRITPD